ncbi:hypothetical protein [Variovorax sp. GT1P44]|uniref:hypothetical protein n=1 Tax=Variovorax sp. GT1P44 TaxID=3443742 RepID=UPI003F44D742
MSYRNILAVALVAGVLISCGGGGSPGLPPTTTTTTGSGNGTGGSTQAPVAAAKVTVDVFNGAGTSTTSISGVEIAQVKAVLKDANGAPVPGSIVTFSEAGGSLLTYSPTSKTALTDATGTAVVEIRAASSANTGATAVAAAGVVAGVAVTSQKAIAITSAPSSGATDPQILASAINFLDVNPADSSIVLKGSGGNGRLESATLRFRIVDSNNSPVKGAAATFSVTPAANVTLNIPTATSDSDGVVVTTVSSQTTPTAVVVKATITGKAVSTQSDQLTVTTGIATQAGFDMSASKYNLNFNKTGDKSTVLVRVRDANGNPVADGVPIVFTADYGVVGTSTRGGCVTSGGACTVDFLVQDPRPADGTPATVTATTALGDGSTIGKQLAFRMVDVGLLNVYNTSAGGAVVSAVNKTGCAAETFSAYAGTPANFPPAAGTTITVKPISSGMTGTLKSASPVADQLGATAARVRVDFELNLTNVTPSPCVVGGANTATANFDIEFSADGVVTTRNVMVSYPTN